MACIINSGYAGMGCLDGIGGAKKVYIGNFDANSTYAVDANNEITGITSGTSYFTFEAELETIEFTETGAIAPANGTAFYDQSLKMVFQKTTSALKNQIKLLVQAELSVIVEAQSGEYYIMGKTNAVRATAVDGGLGVALGDLAGYTLTFTSKEAELAQVVQSTATGLNITGN